ncbi:MAG: SPFH domain-containing protein [Phycisphaerales bacterium JB039]
MAMMFLALGAIVAIGLLALVPRVTDKTARIALFAMAVAAVLAGVTLSSFRFVGENSVGVVVKNAFGAPLPPGKIIATDGEKGPQARVLPPGWHPWLWPVIYDVELVPVVEISEGEVGMLTAADGLPLPADAFYAPEWPEQQKRQMAEDAAFFLGEGAGYKGPQTSVLKPGKYRINTKLFKVEIVPVTNVAKATVGVVKSNVGEWVPSAEGESPLVDRGQQGIWRTPLSPGTHPLNTRAYEITPISTAKQVVRYTKAETAAMPGEEREIIVRSSDGFTFPVDVRIEYEIRPEDAPLVVANFSDDQDRLRERLNSAVRAIFRNNAEDVKALQYVQERSRQEQDSLAALATEMEAMGVTITAVRIGDVGDEQTLGSLLKTQTDREIAVQEQLTFQEQQKAAEQKKQLTRTEQEAEEERRLATASYQVQIAEQDKERRIIEATAEAEAIQIQAEAQADAYRLIAEQIGKGNAALVELLKVVGEQGIQITPRVMIVGDRTGNGAGNDAETTALIGTMLDTMVQRDESPRESDAPQAPGG